eukprot:TRINITY_DN84728_c0_g1_i1.p1 TRINITY_DN84728_c0_g1~~TRINITY_DN84728_c0_g1_i1.p1  ORF type:complete len:582 (+),score=90.64 TRINITY_DN84728_c0_g1_i1:99-1844(+)
MATAMLNTSKRSLYASAMAWQRKVAATAPSLLKHAGMNASSNGHRGFSVSSLAAPDMMCFQCEQTSAGKGCTSVGVCTKTPPLAGLQDLQVVYMKRLCQLAHALGPQSPLYEECAAWVLESSFATLTNVNFDQERFEQFLSNGAALATNMELALASKPLPQSFPDLPQQALPLGHKLEMQELAKRCGILARGQMVGSDDLIGVVEMATYGLKGVIAYFYHAEQIGKGTGAYSEEERSAIYQELFRIGNYLALAGSHAPADLDAALEEALGECMAVGALNLKVMGMLDAAHCKVLGKPCPTEVSTKPVPGKAAILVSGHDLDTLKNLLVQIGDKDIDVYTHGEMLPAHSYPELQKFKNLRGHYGTQWSNQLSEFRKFPGAILMTSNCLRPPTKKYVDRLWTSGPVGFHGCPHINSDEDFSGLIEKALNLPGFEVDSLDNHPRPSKQIVTGFGHDAVLGVADKVLDAIKTKQLNHIFVIGGCDGTETSRSYFTDLAESTPPDSVILTLGCGKFRLLDSDHGTVGGLPRLLDMGQCNDAYSAVVVAVKLAEALGCKVQDLPLHFAVSWFEQKAVAVLLTLCTWR